MKVFIIVFFVFCAVSLAGGTELTPGLFYERPAEWLGYDNGSAIWSSWSGIYRGVWFNLEDFQPGWSSGLDISQSEMWFFHDAEMPWDASDFYCEVWSGDSNSPTSQLDQVLLTAVHYSPVLANYTVPVHVETNFWALINTELSSGGWPSTISDGAGSSIAHSFYTDDFQNWLPWNPSTGISNYFVAILPLPWSLDATTWGALKNVF